MIVIVIVGILSSVALPSFLNQPTKRKRQKCDANQYIAKEVVMMNMEGVSSDDIVTAISGSLPDDADSN